MIEARIARIDARIEERRHKAIFEGVFGGRSRSVVVEVELEDGASGSGEATLLPGWSGEWPPASLVLLEDVLRPALIGCPALAVAARMRVELAANGFLLWALEAAVKAALGERPAPRAVPVRGLVGRVGPERAAALASAQAAEGHRRFKVKLAGDRLEDEARLRAVREAVPEAAIVADANEAIDHDDLAAYLPLFVATEVAGVEQPCSRLAVLEHGLPAPDGWMWIADESIWGYDDALVLSSGPWQAWTLHPGKCRGEDVFDRVTALANEQGVAVVLGSNLEFGPGADGLCRLATRLPPSAAHEVLGHDLAGPVVTEDWERPDLILAGGAVRLREP